MSVGVYGCGMSANLRNYVKSIYAFDHVLSLTSDKALARKSPCAGWTGKDVVEHALGSVKMVHSFTTTGNGPKSTPKLAADPVAQWAKLRDSTIEALDHPGALQSIANEPFGPEFGSVPIDNLVGFMSADLMVHAWDLARTAKVDDRLDPALCKASMVVWKSLPPEIMRGPGMFGPAIKSEKGADVQTRLLNFLGRAT